MEKKSKEPQSVKYGLGYIFLAVVAILPHFILDNVTASEVYKDHYKVARIVSSVVSEETTSLEVVSSVASSEVQTAPKTFRYYPLVEYFGDDSDETSTEMYTPVVDKIGEESDVTSSNVSSSETSSFEYEFDSDDIDFYEEEYEPVIPKEKNTDTDTLSVFRKNYETTSSDTSSIQEPVVSYSQEDVFVPLYDHNVYLNYMNSLNFNNKISRRDIPVFNSGDLVGYVTCESANLYRVPITYGWYQTIIDNYDIGMAGYTGNMFSDKYISIICGHNFKALSQLKFADSNDYVIIETIYGANYRYIISVSCKGILQEDDVAYRGFTDMDGNWINTAYEESRDLVLFTCFDMENNFYRWIVRAKYAGGTLLE